VSDFLIENNGIKLAGSVAGEGDAIILLHGLTATRRYVVMGSRLLERSGFKVVTYDARGHGESAPALEPRQYQYSDLAGDLSVVMNHLGLEKAIIAGASMGAHTAVRFALDSPERVSGLVLITPAFVPEITNDLAVFKRWDKLAQGLEEGGVQGFLAAYGEPQVRPEWRDTVKKVIEQRMSRHSYPLAVADALRVVPRSRPFEGEEVAKELTVPVTIVGSRDTSDPEHPLAVAERYSSEFFLGAKLICEAEGESPIAWQGRQLSQVILELARQA